MFNVEEETKKIIEFIKSYFKKHNIGGVVIGISGGKDSAVVSALFARAIGCENIIGVTLPLESQVEDEKDAKLISEKYGFELINIDLTKTYKTFKEQINNLNVPKQEFKDADINIKPRLRMSALYYVAQMYSHLKGETYIVAGTSNKCELYVGYFTKGGDSSYDIGILNDFTVDEVIKIGEYLSVPQKVLYKTPSDGLSGISDEDKLKVKYSEISSLIKNEKIEEEAKRKIEILHEKANHKFNIPIYKRESD